MRKWKMFYLPALALLIQTIAMAQTEAAKSEDGLMRSNGKIYVVVAVLLTILAGIVYYIIRLDRKISKLEKEA